MRDSFVRCSNANLHYKFPGKSKMNSAMKGVPASVSLRGRLQCHGVPPTTLSYLVAEWQAVDKIIRTYKSTEVLPVTIKSGL